MSAIGGMPATRGKAAHGTDIDADGYIGWREARPVVQAIPAAIPHGGAAFALRYTSPHLGSLALSAAAWLCVTWSVYLLNGVHDQTEDRRNGLSRPLATGELAMPVARSVVPYPERRVRGAIVSWRVGALAALMLGPGRRHVAGWGLADNTKDQSHVAGDRAADVRTLPLLGDAPARRLIAGLTIALATTAVALAALRRPPCCRRPECCSPVPVR